MIRFIEWLIWFGSLQKFVTLEIFNVNFDDLTSLWGFVELRVVVLVVAADVVFVVALVEGEVYLYPLCLLYWAVDSCAFKRTAKIATKHFGKRICFTVRNFKYFLTQIIDTWEGVSGGPEFWEEFDLKGFVAKCREFCFCWQKMLIFNWILASKI